MKNVAIIGIQGIPANYGGFESLVENIIGENRSPSIQYTVFCSSKDCKEKLHTYKNAILKYIPLHANGVQSIPYDILSLIQVIKGYDVIVILGTSGCLFLPVFRLLCRQKLIVNIDGLEHRREKWSQLAKHILRWSEVIAVRYADNVITDNKAIQDYVRETYNKKSNLIAYGGDHVLRNISETKEIEIIDKYNLRSKSYYISICRIEPENNCHITLETFARSNKTLVFIGNWDKNEYGQQLKKTYSGISNISILNPIYNLDILYILRKHASCYIHGHSAGGTNPSLVEAMFFGIPVFSFDVIYNRETTENKAHYYSTAENLCSLIENLKTKELSTGDMMKEIAYRRYKWTEITKLYEQLY